jgi:hypothetical protein
MHNPFGNAFAVEVLHLLEQFDVLHQHRATRPGGKGLLHADRLAGLGSGTGVSERFFCMSDGALLFAVLRFDLPTPE